MFRAARVLLLIVPLFAHGANPERAPDTWSIVVGVSEYPQLGSSATLEGPRNDVPLVMSWLARESVPRKRITVLADHVAGADGLPTRGAILSALDAVAARAASGDRVFLYFAGHGMQVPQAVGNRSKTDGMEEVFLPRDAALWNAAQRRIPGAIRGDEFGQRITAMRARGVFVWLVVDSCHSATLARGATLLGVRARGLPAQAFGVPLSDLPRAASSAPVPLIRIVEGNLPGRYVAFYAAQTTEMAPELPLPTGAPERRVHGLFTFALLRSLATGGARSYRELSHQILALYSAIYPRTTPEFEGALDLPLGATATTPRPSRTWPARNTGDEFEIAAGRLNDITPGTLLELTEAPAGRLRPERLGLLRVTRSSLTTAWAQGISDPATLRHWRVARDRTQEVGAGLVHVLQSDIDLTIRIAALSGCEAYPSTQLDCNASASSVRDAGRSRVREILARPGILPAGVELTPDASRADLFAFVTGQRFHILRASSVAAGASRGASVDIGTANPGPGLQDALMRAARAVGLMRLGADFADPGDELAVELRMRDRTGQWRAVSGAAAAQVPFDAQLAVRLQNIGSRDIDVTVLSINDQFEIAPVFPVDLETNRLRRGSARLEVGGWARPSGAYQLLVISEPALPGKPHDLSFLAQPGTVRAVREQGLGGLLDSVAFERQRTRSFEDVGAGGRIRVVGYQVLESGTPSERAAR